MYKESYPYNKSLERRCFRKSGDASIVEYEGADNNSKSMCCFISRNQIQVETTSNTDEVPNHVLLAEVKENWRLPCTRVYSRSLLPYQACFAMIVETCWKSWISWNSRAFSGTSDADKRQCEHNCGMDNVNLVSTILHASQENIYKDLLNGLPMHIKHVV